MATESKKIVVMNNSAKQFKINCKDGVVVDLQPGRNAKLTAGDVKSLKATGYFKDLEDAEILEVK